MSGVSSQYKIGILQAGNTPERMREQFGCFPTLVAALIDQDNIKFTYDVFDILENNFPETVNECDGWVITGSKYSVYDDHEWISELSQFIQESFDKNIPVVGICYGHQAIAHAMGGEVKKSENGWGLGLHYYEVNEELEKSLGKRQIAMPAFHQDQVVKMPEGAQLLGFSDFCPNAILGYPGKAFSVQAHPEYCADCLYAWLEDNNLVELSEEQLCQIKKSLKCNANDRRAIGAYIANFFTNHFQE